MEHLFDRWFRDWDLAAPATERELTRGYPVDVWEDDGKLIVDAELPGFKREQVDVTIENGVLTIKAERQPEETNGTRHLAERRSTRVARCFSLPAAVDESKIEASLHEGVLHLELPLTEESKAKRIAVK